MTDIKKLHVGDEFEKEDDNGDMGRYIITGKIKDDDENVIGVTFKPI